MLFNVEPMSTVKAEYVPATEPVREHRWITLPPLVDSTKRSDSLPKFDFPVRGSWPFSASNSSPFLPTHGSARPGPGLAPAPSLTTVPPLDRYAEHHFESDSPESFDGGSSSTFSPRQRNPSLTSMESELSMAPVPIRPAPPPAGLRCPSGRIVKGYDKVQHKVKERRRRGNIAKEMHFLRVLVPGCVPGRAGGPKETSKHECLQKTGAYIVNLQKELLDRERELADLRQETEEPRRRHATDPPEATQGQEHEAAVMLRQVLNKVLTNRDDKEATTILDLLEASRLGKPPRDTGTSAGHNMWPSDHPRPPFAS
ncbi:MAG: hypothetical protein M1838_004343 [Thelocarpon superellum]|nr:MAG: hypothetical protein M1838_004343 [Thelocarpon superellum]